MVRMSYLCAEGKQFPYRVAFLGPRDIPRGMSAGDHSREFNDTDRYTLADLKEKLPEMRAWCEETVGGLWDNPDGLLLFRFENEEDALMFKMAWG